jgi:hypothetical protein
MPISPAAKRLISFVKGIPADRHEEVGKHFDAKHKKVMQKHETEYLIAAAEELSKVTIPSKADLKEKEKAKKEKGKDRKIKKVKKK